MNTNIKIKLLLITLTSIIVLGGGFMYFADLIDKSKSPSYMLDGKLIIPNQDNQLNFSKNENGFDLPKYKASKHRGKSNNQDLGNGAISPVDMSNLISSPNLSFYDIRSSDNKTNRTSEYRADNSNNEKRIYSNQTILLSSNNQSYGKRSAAIASTGAGSYSSSISSIPAPMLAPSPSDVLSHGLTGNTDEPDDGFLPPEGAPVGEGVMILLIFAGLYFFSYRRK